MESSITPNPQDAQDAQDARYKQVTVDVPKDRVGEFHAFFGRFLAARGGRRHGRRARHLGHHHHGRGCAHGHERAGGRNRAERCDRAEQRERAEQGESPEQQRPTVETTEL